MLPIGDHYTMGPREAAYAINLLKPKTVIPMHFGTFPLLTGTPSELQKLVSGVEVLEMKPGVTSAVDRTIDRMTNASTNAKGKPVTQSKKKDDSSQLAALQLHHCRAGRRLSLFHAAQARRSAG